MLYLASSSPRRRELLEKVGIPFTCILSHGDESRPPELSPGELVQELARRKAFAAEKDPGPGDIILGADTLVALGDRVLGKPSSREEAFSMLSALSGKVHTVYTGCCLRMAEGSESFLSAAEVEFYPLSPKEIQAYIETGEPMDKAGAYGIQGKGCVLVKAIRGDYFTIVGLPVAEVIRRVRRLETEGLSSVHISR